MHERLSRLLIRCYAVHLNDYWHT